MKTDKSMHHTFPSKVGGWYGVIMGITAFLLFDFFWFHYTVLMILIAVAMVFEIEMLIHTRYVITADGKLRIESGRFVPDTEIDIRSVVGMRRVKSFSLAPALSAERIEIVYRKEGKERSVQVSPQRAEEFRKWMQKKMGADNQPNVE